MVFKGGYPPKDLQKAPKCKKKMIIKYVIEFEIIIQPLFKLFKNMRAFKSIGRSKLDGFWGFASRNTKL